LSPPPKGASVNIIDNYYTDLDISESWAIKPGQLYYTHVVYPQHYPVILKLIQYDPRNEPNSKFEIKPYSDGDEKHYPAKELHLRQDEMYYIYTGKKRLVIVIGYLRSQWLDKNKPQEVLLCAPVFGFLPEHNQELVIRTQAFDFPNLFYLPQAHDGCSKDSAVRFEMIQPIMRGYVQPYLGTLSRKPVILTLEAYWLMMTYLIKFLNGKIIDSKLDKDICDYRELLLDAWKKKETS
jgi:hypothetical protein